MTKTWAVATTTRSSHYQMGLWCILIGTYIYIYIHIRTYTYICKYIHMYLYTHMTGTWAVDHSLLSLSDGSVVYIDKYIYIYIHTYMYIHIYLHIYTYVHVYTHMTGTWAVDHSLLSLSDGSVVYIDKFIYMYTYRYVCTHLFTYIYICVYIYTLDWDVSCGPLAPLIIRLVYGIYW